MNLKEYKEYISEINEGLQECALDDPGTPMSALVQDIASDVLSETAGEGLAIKKFLESQGIADAHGCLAQDMMNGRTNL